MSPDAVAQIEGPGQIRRLAIRVVGKARQKTAQTAHGDTNAQRHREQIARAASNTCQPLHDLYTKPATQQSSDDRLAPR